MKLKLLNLGIIVVGLLPALSSMAQNQDSQILSLDDALHKTMTNNPQIKALHYEEKAAEQERKAAFGLRLPQINAMGSYVHMGDNMNIDLNNLKQPVGGLMQGLAGALPPAILEQAGALLKANWELTLQQQDLGFAGANVVMPLYMGGKISAANNAAKINEKTTMQSGSQTRNALVSQLVERYYGLVLANQVVQVRSEVLRGMKVHLQDAIALENNGIIAKGDRLYVEVKVAEAQREFEKAQMQQQTIAAALNNTLGEVDMEYMPVTTMFILENIETLSYFQDLAQKNNPLLAQVALKRDLAKQGVKLERSEFLPQVALMGGGNFYNYQVTKMLPRWAVGAGVKLKIFDGLNREYKFSAAKNKVRQVEAIEVQAKSDISVLIEKLYNEMRTYASQMNSIETSLDFAKEYLRIKDAAFKEGMSSATDLIDAQLNLAAIKTERLQSSYYYDLMLARLLEASGVSEEFGGYARRDSAKQIVVDKN